jgi:hypothetical protein
MVSRVAFGRLCNIDTNSKTLIDKDSPTMSYIGPQRHTMA